MSATPAPTQIYVVTDPDTGLPVPGAKILTYDVDTTTPKTTWGDADKVGANPNPVVCDAHGQAKIFIEGSYKFIVNRPDNTLLYEINGIIGGSDAFDRPASGITSLPFDDITAENVQAALEQLGLNRVKTSDTIPIARGGTGGATAFEGLDNLSQTDFVDAASAATVDLGAIDSQNVRITGSVTITSFGTVAAGTFRRLTFAAALQITYNATSMLTPTAANLHLGAGARLEAVSLGSGNWRIMWVDNPENYHYLNRQVFTGDGTYTPTPGTRRITVQVVAGGGGGGGADSNGGGEVSAAAGGGGGAGEYAEADYLISSLSATVAVDIGAAGSGGAASGANGTAGADTTFGAYLTAGGGNPGTGIAVTVTYEGGEGGTGGGGGSSSGSPIGLFRNNGGDGDGGVCGDGGVGSGLINAKSGHGGASFFGGGGRGRITQSSQLAGGAGRGYGAGGGGAAAKTATGAAGGDGKAGICIIREFA